MTEGDTGRRMDGLALVDAYEQLRRTALGHAVPGAPGRGAALLRRGGLAAWMQSVGCVPTTSYGQRGPSPAWRPVMPAPELVTILTHMVMARAQEVRR